MVRANLACKASVWGVKCLLNSSEYCSQVALAIYETHILGSRNDSQNDIYPGLTHMRYDCKLTCKFAQFLLQAHNFILGGV